MYFPKIEAIVGINNNLLEEILDATAMDSCANIQPIKAKVSGIMSDFTEVIKLTTSQQQNCIIGNKIKKDDWATYNLPISTGSTYIIRLPVAIPIVAKQSIKLGKISNANLFTSMDSYHPVVDIWASTVRYWMPGKNSIGKVTMSNPTYELANNKATP
eukprot:10134385-Ditylum_brightwellii.AAC.1